MEFWQYPIVSTALMLSGLLLLAELVRAAVPPLRRVGVPASIIAGVLGLLLGSQVLGLLPMNAQVLEAGVYHALGIVFIAVGLQSPGKSGATAETRSFSFAITLMVILQTVVGLALVMGLGLVMGEALHPGFGLMLPMGFEQGPGQALSIGGAWEKGGMPSGAQVGLITAAIGFAWSIGVGVGLVAWGRRKGLVSPPGAFAPPADEAGGAEEALSGEAPGAVGHLTKQVLIIGVIYSLTYYVSYGLAELFSGMPDIAPMAWGFHFLWGALLAMVARPLLGRLPGGGPIHSATQARIAAITVDFATVAAISAIQLAVLRANWLPILIITTAGGATTLVAAVWFVRRAVKSAPFEHAVLLYGMATGTLPTGLALLRIIDPELRSPATMSAVLGSAGAIIGVAPILLVLHPIAISGWGEGWPGAGWTALGASVAYLAVTVVLWRLFGGLRFGSPEGAEATAESA